MVHQCFRNFYVGMQKYKEHHRTTESCFPRAVETTFEHPSLLPDPQCAICTNKKAQHAQSALRIRKDAYLNSAKSERVMLR